MNDNMIDRSIDPNGMLAQRIIAELSAPNPVEGPGDLGRMAQLVEQMDQFFASQAVRLEQMIEPCRQALRMAEKAQEMRRALDEERAEWSRQRDDELQQFSDERQRLIDAWSRIEEEHRELAVQAAGLAQSPATPAQAALTVESPNSATRSSGEASAEQALHHLRQLKREMTRHARRTNR